MTERADFAKPDAPCAIDQRSLQIMMAAARYQTARLARSLRLSPAQREDAEQEILLILLERRRYFDATRGPWTAFAHRIARQAVQVIADQICLERRRMPLSLDHTLGGACEEGDEGAISLADMLRDAHALPDEQALMSLAMDNFLTRLPPVLSLTAMFVLVADGDLASAQRASGLTTSEFYRRLREIRYRLVSIGIVDRRALFDL
jgi:DNA-directed RNA polymerase specialized sigma24 family protein